MHHPVQFQQMAKSIQADRVRLANAHRAAQQPKQRSFAWTSIPGKIAQVLAGLKGNFGRSSSQRGQGQA